MEPEQKRYCILHFEPIHSRQIFSYTMLVPIISILYIIFMQCFKTQNNPTGYSREKLRHQNSVKTGFLNCCMINYATWQHIKTIKHIWYALYQCLYSLIYIKVILKYKFLLPFFFSTYILSLLETQNEQLYFCHTIRLAGSLVKPFRFKTMCFNTTLRLENSEQFINIFNNYYIYGVSCVHDLFLLIE